MNLIFYILIAMAFSAFFSGMEIAFISADRLRLKMDKNEKSISSGIHSFFFRQQDTLASALVVGNCLSIVIYGILIADFLGTYILNGLIENYYMSIILQIIIATLLILITEEFIPKTFLNKMRILLIHLFQTTRHDLPLH